MRALPLLGDDPFLVVSADVVTDFDFATVAAPGARRHRALDATGHLVLVPNPPQHPDGDFGLNPDGKLAAKPPLYTFSGIAVLHPALFVGLAPGIRPLRDVLRPAARRGVLLGEVFQGLWRDVGTPERLAVARALMGVG